MEKADVKEAMASVVRAHQVLADFHREIVAFFGLVDELVRAKEGAVILQPDPQNQDFVVHEVPARLSDAEDWAPIWFGRFYRNAAAFTDEADVVASPVTKERLVLGFVWIVAAPSNSDFSDANGPECIFGVADPGLNGKAKHLWDAARYGVWPQLPTAKLVRADWREGSFSDGSGKFGTGTMWCAQRRLLEELVDRDAIQTLVAAPLLAKFAEKFPAGAA